MITDDTKEYMELADHIGHPCTVARRGEKEMVIECQKCNEVLYGVDDAGTIQYIGSHTCQYCKREFAHARYNARTEEYTRLEAYVWCKGQCGKEDCNWSGCKDCHTGHMADIKRAEKPNARKPRKAARRK